MIEAPSGKSGSAFCTVNRRPFTLMLKIESYSSSVMVPKAANFATPANAGSRHESGIINAFLRF